MKAQAIRLKALLTSMLAAFTTTACLTTTPVEPKRQTGHLVTDPSGCTYWKDSADPQPKAKSCILEDTIIPPNP